jgi:hypothetical protein
MAYAISRNIPIDAATYKKVRELLPAEPKGLVTHLVLQREGALQYIDVWESEADFDRFFEEHVEPAITTVMGVTPPRNSVPVEQLDLVDVMVGG